MTSLVKNLKASCCESLENTNNQRPTGKVFINPSQGNLNFSAAASKKFFACFRIIINDEAGSCYHVHGRLAQTLLCLDRAKNKGVTAAEMSSWALRLSAYVHKLRQKYGLEIRMEKEKHDGGWHGRYVLESQIELKVIIEA